MSTRSPCRSRCCSPSRSRSCPPGASRCGLGLYLDAFPEGDIASDVLGRVLGRWVIPGGVLVDLAVHIYRSEEHTSELQSQSNLVCRLLLEKKNHVGNESIEFDEDPLIGEADMES